MKAQLSLAMLAVLPSLTQSTPLLHERARWQQQQYDAPVCNCTGTTDGGNASRASICNDARLGPKILPRMLPLSSFLTSYDRFGGLTPAEYLARWTNASTGTYRYPPDNGFSLDQDGHGINGTLTLEVGTLVDRFGSEFGSFVSAAEAPYSQRSLPPTNLATSPSAPEYPYNYHIYQVLKPFEVVGGPIAPWFGQPGLGAQFYTGATGNIMKLIDDQYLARVNISVLISNLQGCGVGDCYW
ncbi:hypothetical protein PVAG01_06563 [Phlyctema vagabunda]|uniref:TNT domain-containing protein n=1 Tax=Phlyctema vagabunda TaxID=108571 RepID=A0ABR4PH25_9HELO